MTGPRGYDSVAGAHVTPSDPSRISLLMSLQRDVGNTVVARMLSRDPASGGDDGGGVESPVWAAPLQLGRQTDRAGAYRALDELSRRVVDPELSRQAGEMLAVLGMGRGRLQAAEVEVLTALGERLAAADRA